jgi:L-arabinose isomerase
MAKGYGFAGEGDTSDRRARPRRPRLLGDAHFTEMYAMDFPTDSILMSHMGEGNWKDRPLDRRCG